MSVMDWADLQDNRIGPILRELAEAAEATNDDETLRQLASRLKFMAGAIQSHRQRTRSLAGYATPLRTEKPDPTAPGKPGATILGAQ